MKLGVDTGKNHRHYDPTDRTEGIRPNWSTTVTTGWRTETIERIIMTTLTIHDVIETTTRLQDHGDFTCQTITIKTADGRTTDLKLFRSEPIAEGVDDVLQDAQDVYTAYQDDLERQAAKEAQEAREAQEAKEAKEAPTTEMLLSTIKHSLDDWGLSGYPEHSKLLFQLYLEANRPGSNISFHAPTLRKAFIWERSLAGHAFYSDAYKWSVNNY